MSGTMPHIVQYQGSKRKLAPQILQYMPKKFSRLVEPFSGMAAISIASAYENRADSYWINDLNAPLVGILDEAINSPQKLLEEYTVVWNEQFYCDNHVQHFYDVRERFNAGEKTPANMLYLLARCVKGSVRYGKNGNFNQSPDKRRHGVKPDTLAENIYAISNLLREKTIFSSVDYHEILNQVSTGDLVYMDPPYQGVTNVRDNRYCSGVSFEEFTSALEILNSNNIDFLISYDGECGGKTYGKDLPESLGCKKIMLNAGLSSQATLLGERYTTHEALYVSKNLIPLFESAPHQISFEELSA